MNIKQRFSGRHAVKGNAVASLDGSPPPHPPHASIIIIIICVIIINNIMMMIIVIIISSNIIIMFIISSFLAHSGFLPLRSPELYFQKVPDPLELRARSGCLSGR